MAAELDPEFFKALIASVKPKGEAQFLEDGISDGKEDIDSETLPEQIDLKRAQTARYKSDTNDRKWLAEWSATVVSIWLALVLGILACNYDKFHLSDTVLNVLLGTTTLNVLGLTYIVLKGHFNNRD
jgi:hypothetical protein